MLVCEVCSLRLLKYSTGITSKPFWYIETKKTAKYMANSFDKKDIKKLVLNENLYQTKSEKRSIHIFNSIYKRLESLDDDYLINRIAVSDAATSKILILFSIMKTDQLFFEFVSEVFCEKLIIRDYTLTQKDINVFFEHKKTQSGVVFKWSESTIKKLKSSYLRVLFEVGLTRGRTSDKEIIPVLPDYNLCQYLVRKGMTSYLYSIMGDCYK
jgi:hypothetical protein